MCESPSGVIDASVISGELFPMAFLGPAVHSRGLRAAVHPVLVQSSHTY